MLTIMTIIGLLKIFNIRVVNPDKYSSVISKLTSNYGKLVLAAMFIIYSVQGVGSSHTEKTSRAIYDETIEIHFAPVMPNDGSVMKGLSPEKNLY